MTKQIFTAEQNGFVGAYYGGPADSRKAVILMLGDSSTDRMARCGAGWLIRNGCHALCMSADKKDYGHHNYPLERFGKAIAFLKGRDMEKIGIAGASTTGMLALVAASYFVMEGFYRDGKDGAAERPGDGESSVSWQGKPLPFLPYAYRHPEYWQQLQAEAKAGGDRAAARQMFDESERLHPIREEEKIKVERIRGKILFVGAQDDVLWDTCRYIRRMEERLSSLPHDCAWEALLYQHGTHFVFPDSMLRSMLPLGSGLLVKLMFRAGREHPKECKATRIDIDRRLQAALQAW